MNSLDGCSEEMSLRINWNGKDSVLASLNFDLIRFHHSQKDKRVNQSNLEFSLKNNSPKTEISSTYINNLLTIQNLK